MPKEVTAEYGRQDRDLLVELRTLVQGLREDLKALSDVFQAKIQDHELRIRKLEEDQIKYDPAPRIIRYDKMLSEWESVKSNWKLLLSLGGVGLTLVSIFGGYILRNFLGK